MGLLWLEDSLSNSPDWFEWDRLEAHIAGLMGFDKVDAVIRDEVVRRLVALRALRYANGAACVPAGIEEWAARLPPRAEEAAAEDVARDPEADSSSMRLEHRVTAVEAGACA